MAVAKKKAAAKPKVTKAAAKPAEEAKVSSAHRAEGPSTAGPGWGVGADEPHKAWGG